MSERGKYPYLTEDIRNAPEITIIGADGQPYQKKIFSFGDLGHLMTPELSREISTGLAEKIKKWQGQFYYLVALNPGGGSWGLLLAHDCRADLVIGWVNRGGPLYEIDLEDEFRAKVGGPHGRELCFRGINPADRVVILDDVIATGETIRGVITAFNERSVTVVGVLTITTKGNEYKRIEQDFGIPVESLVNLDEKGELSVRKTNL